MLLSTWNNIPKKYSSHYYLFVNYKKIKFIVNTKHLTSLAHQQYIFIELGLLAVNLSFATYGKYPVMNFYKILHTILLKLGIYVFSVKFCLHVIVLCPIVCIYDFLL